MRLMILVVCLFNGCLSVGCVGVAHITNNFPPGRNEMGLFGRSTTDLGIYSDTGDTNTQEASSAMIGGTVTKPGEGAPAMPDQPSPPPDVSGRPSREPPSSPGAAPTAPGNGGGSASGPPRHQNEVDAMIRAMSPPERAEYLNGIADRTAALMSP